MKGTIGFITCNYSAKEHSALSEARPIASLPCYGRYRLVDFSLSNLVNCGINAVAMVLPFNYRSIIDHIGSGKEWGLDRKSGGLFLMPGSAFGTSRTGARFLLRDISQNKVFFLRSHAEHVIFMSANFVFNADLNGLITAHEASGADITMLTASAKEDNPDVTAVFTEDGRVKAVRHGVKGGSEASLDCFIVGRRLLLDMLDWYSTTDFLDLFEAMAGDFERVDVRTFPYEGYHEAIFSIRNFYRANMDLLDPYISAEIFNNKRGIMTKAHDTPPAKFEPGGHVKNSCISSGCRLFGTVEGSILGRNVIVESGAEVKDSVIMQNCIVRAGSKVQYAIVDRGNVIPEGTEFCGTSEDILIKEKGRI